MQAIEEYYKINYVLLKALGLWPYPRHSYFVQAQKAFSLTIFVTFMITQLLILVTTQPDLNLVLSTLSFVFPCGFITVKYMMFVIQANNVKLLLEQIRNDWALLNDKFEIDIIVKYASNTMYLTICILALIFFGGVCCVIFQYLPVILDVVVPLNETRPCSLIVKGEYFINQEKYFSAVFLHQLLTYYLCAIVVCSTGTILIIYVHHACALFRIASYRIENVIQKEQLKMSSPKKERLFHQKIVRAVTVHRRATKFIEFLTSAFVVWFMILIIIGVVSLSLNLFHFLQLISLTNDMSEAIIFFLFTIEHMLYMFIGNYMGQEVIDQGIQLFAATYEGLWYVAPLRTQKLLLFVMQNGLKGAILTCGGIFDASLEGFATLVSSAISYLTVMYSNRK